MAISAVFSSMNKTKLMEVFDASYNDTFNQILEKVPDREEAKKLIGLIYREAMDRLNSNAKKMEDVKIIFEESKIRHGISFA